MRFTTSMAKYWIKNISGNIKAAFFKLGTRNVHQQEASFYAKAVVPVYAKSEH